MKRFFTRSLVNSRQAELIQVMGVAMNVNTSLCTLGRRCVHRKGSEAIISKPYNCMRLACTRKRGEVENKRGPMRFVIEPWPDFDTNCFRVGGPVS